MTDQPKWAERRQRMVRCKIHRLHYDPQMTSGCALCLREAAKTVPQRAPQFTLILLCILGMALVLYQVFGPGQSLGVDSLLVEEETILAPPPTFTRLAPGPHRQPLETLESELFAAIEDSDDLRASGASSVAAAQALSESIRRLEAPDHAVAAAVDDLAGSVSETFRFADRERLRQDWLELRRRNFQPAPWFRSAVAKAAPEVRVLVAQHRDLADSLRALVFEGVAAAQELEAAADDEARKAQWQETAADWRRRLDELWQPEPQRPAADADLELLIAVQALEEAYRRCRALAAEPSLARSGDAAVRFDQAMVLVDKAQRTFVEIY